MYGYMNDSRDYIPYAAWWSSGDGWAISWDDLLDVYLGAKRSPVQRREQYFDAAIGSEVLFCAQDPMQSKMSPQGAAGRSYSMPRAIDDDGVAQGVGDISSKSDPPQQFRIGVDVPAASATFLVVERSAKPLGGAGAHTNLQGGRWFAEVDRPQQQMPGEDYLGPPMGRGVLIHGAVNQPLFNYLYCDGHVRTWQPEQTLGTATSVNDAAKGPWTRSNID